MIRREEWSLGVDDRLADQHLADGMIGLLRNGKFPLAPCLYGVNLPGARSVQEKSWFIQVDGKYSIVHS